MAAKPPARPATREPIAARARAMPSPSVTALRRWLVFVALLRLLSGRGEEEGGARRAVSRVAFNVQCGKRGASRSCV